ncbi:hypothetical protein Csp2054_15905 [Curtobacterium sp. 'Ferrero']|nr:hypothetical protein Csp2054_15905 [Curtobacterium sp. 'Ferrero']
MVKSSWKAAASPTTGAGTSPAVPLPEVADPVPDGSGVAREPGAVDPPDDPAEAFAEDPTDGSADDEAVEPSAHVVAAGDGEAEGVVDEDDEDDEDDDRPCPGSSLPIEGGLRNARATNAVRLPTTRTTTPRSSMPMSSVFPLRRGLRRCRVTMCS